MKPPVRFLIVLFGAAALLLGLWVGVGLAQQPVPERAAEVGAVDARSNFIPIQGRLTNAAGTPLNGYYNLTIRIYDAYSGGTALCTDDISSVLVEDGLFSTAFDMAGCTALDGRQLYLSIQVADDPEMTPRAFIDNVPYAWTLRPGAEISGTMGSNAILDIDNYSPTGRGLRAEAQSSTGVNYAVIGASKSPQGFGGYFYNNGGGTGLYGQSDTGAAIVAGGTGIIRSAATSSVWISGSSIRKYRETDTFRINMGTTGGGRIIGNGAASGNVMVPITLPGVLYGQNVTVTGLSISFVTTHNTDYITAILLRRQTGVCETAACYDDILFHTADHYCHVAANATGCTLNFDLTANNVLSADSGVLYLTIEAVFGNAASIVDIGGIKLTLIHE